MTIQDTADVEVIKNRIYEVRGLRVMLDRDLAELYGVETGVLNQAVRRNIAVVSDLQSDTVYYKDLQSASTSYSNKDCSTRRKYSSCGS